MPRPTAFSTEKAATIIGARLVGASLRRCVAAAGVPWATFTVWLERGRRAVAAHEAGEAFATPHDAVLADFAAKIDAADSQLETTLWSRVLRGTEKDPRLALDVLRWRAGKAERDAELGLLKAKREVEEKRAKGEHVDRVEHSTRDPLDELRSRLDRIALTGDAGDDPRRNHN
jgi:hypothetical protein